MKNVRSVITAMVIGLALVGGSAELAFAKPKQPEKVQIEKTLSGRTNPKTAMGNKVRKAIDKAIKLSEDDKFAEANKILSEVLSSAKTPYEISKTNQIMASYYWQQEQYDDAYKAAQAAVQANGLDNIEHLQTMFMAVQILTQQEKYKEAVAAFDAYAKEAPKLTGSEYATQAINYYYQDDYKNAIAFIDKAIATGDAPQKQWSQIKANSYYQGEDYKGAVAYLKELMVKEPDNIKQWMSLTVSSYLSLDDYPSAQAVLVDAKGKGLLDSEALWTQLYQLYGNNEQYVQAADTIDEGIKAQFLKPNAKVKNSQGQYMYMAAQDKDGTPEAKPYLERAIAAFQAAAADDDKDGTAELWLGQIALFEQDNAKAARDYLSKAVSKTLKQPGNAYYYLGVAEDQNGNKAGARAALTKALAYPESKANAEKYLRNLK